MEVQVSAIKNALYLVKMFIKFYVPMKWEQFKMWFNYIVKKVF